MHHANAILFYILYTKASVEKTGHCTMCIYINKYSLIYMYINVYVVYSLSKPTTNNCVYIIVVYEDNVYLNHAEHIITIKKKT